MVTLLEEFGAYLQKSFDPLNLKRKVPIEHELELLRAYLHIQKERFGHRLNIVWQIDDNIDGCIPQLTIQPIVENALEHGIIKRMSGGTIEINLKKRYKDIDIMIHDDGVGKDKETIEQIQNNTSLGVGIANTNKRLKQIFGQGLNIKSAHNKGTTVTFKVPTDPTVIQLY